MRADGPAMKQSPIDPVLLRRALGAFVTGVTVLTTRTAAGDPVGITVNSFNTVSLSPPLVLWSLSLRAASFTAFVQATHFVVNVLGADQISLSERFATTGGDKFSGVAWRRTLADMPLLEGTAASFTCRNAHQFPGGDHLIFVGEVVAFEQGTCTPLVYAGGRYTSLNDSPDAGQSGAKSRKIIGSR
ncbi:MAG TPA: flavin reductase family protein [Burkholderiales bacterium]|nr:flavin reductase family protein [Burkholderiales bacterium]